MSESSLIKLQVLRTSTLLKKDSKQVFPVNFVNYQRTPILQKIHDGCETPVRFFKNTFFYRTSPVAASGSFRIPACNFIKKEARAKMFTCEFWKVFKNIF